MANIIKEFNGSNTFVMGKPSDSDFELIKELLPSDDVKAEDLFTYKVKLCDNMIDRDNEIFSIKALNEAANKFKGVIGITNHHPDVESNHSRIYKTEVVTSDDILNDFGDPYTCVIAYAYTLNNESNSLLIEEIKAGIKSEVSIGFACNHRICSICNSEFSECEHICGHEYDIKNKKVICVGVLDSIDDAYEWSFVSIPAQRRAGVVKKYDFKEGTMNFKELALEIAKSLDSETSSKFLAAVDEVIKPENEILKSLNLRVKELEEEIQSKDDIISDMVEAEKSRKLAEALDQLFGELKPVNDKMRKLAEGVISELVGLDDDGNVTGIEEAKAELQKEEYKPLFTGCKSETNPDDPEGGGDPDDETAKAFRQLTKQKSKVDFTRISNFKSSEQKYSAKSAGINTL